VDVQFFGEAALASVREGDWQRNLDVNAAAARLTPWCGRTHYYCGNVLLHRLVDTEGALAAFRTAWQRDPFDEVSYDYYLSLLLTRSDRPKRLEEAASAIRYEELELRPKNPNPPLRLAYVHIRQGRLVQAWEALDRADERTSRGLRKKGLRSGLARGAILRVAGPDQLGLLDRLGTWRDVTAEDWERGYHAPNAEDAVTDALAVSRIFLEGGSPQRALDLLDEAARRSLKKENVPHPKAQRMRSAVVTLKAWALAALGMAAPAKAKLRSVLDIKTRLTAQAAPDVLRSVPEFRALFAEDEELRNLVETLAARRKEAN
jgi:tetratricopeptide (TPR) repeat protein